MCGLAAVSGAISGEDVALVRRMNRWQRHRGPDSEELWQSPHVALGQTRLAVVDLSDTGRQPFVSRCGRVRVIYNGELYNHAALRRRYGLQVVSSCDGAILPELWCRFGPAMFAELRGMFAIVVHDARDGRLTLARDRFGIKPLYWSRGPRGTLRVASEPRALARAAGRVAIDGQALGHYLAYGSLGRDMSPFLGIHAVPANGWVTFSPDNQVMAEGVGPELPDDDPPTTGQLREALVESVDAHLLSDVPVALLLSSGVDSSALAWAARDAGVRLTCVTVGMTGAPREDRTAAAVAHAYGHEHVTVDRPPHEQIGDGFFAAMQRPSIDGLNSYMINEAISSLDIKVALSGLGGDEVLGGYAHFRHLRGLQLLKATDLLGIGRVLGASSVQRRLGRRLGEKGPVVLARGGPRDAASYARLRRRVFLDADVAWLAGPDNAVAPPAIAVPTGGTTARDLSKAELDGYLGGTLLPDADAFSMCWSVELRVPFVDTDFATAALAFDPRRGVGKRRFAAAIGDPLLVRAARQPKQGFTLPMDRWLRAGPLRSCVEKVRGRSALIRSVLSSDAIDAVVRSWEAGQVSWSRLWLLAALEGWLRSLEFPVDVT